MFLHHSRGSVLYNVAYSGEHSAICEFRERLSESFVFWFIAWQEDRPLFIQFCANNPETLLEAAKFVQDDCDYIDINFGYGPTFFSSPASSLGPGLTSSSCGRQCLYFANTLMFTERIL